VTVRGELWWPYAGRTRDRTRGTLVAAYGEKPMAIDTLLASAIFNIRQAFQALPDELGISVIADRDIH